jgi:hypothetical protein
MVDPATLDKPHDPGRIDIQTRIELQYWCSALRCTEAELTHAVGKVGDHVTVVREYLASHHCGAR